MAKKQTSEIVRKYHSAARSQLGLFFVPLLLLVLMGVSVLLGWDKAVHGGQRFPVEWYAIPAGVLVLLLLWSRLRVALTTKFVVYLDSIEHSVGFVSRRTSLVRIADIRNITVRQSVLDRLLMLGDVAFSSAAGDRDEVLFVRISNPNAVKRLVKSIQDRLADDGRIDARERAEIEGGSATGRAAPKPAARPAPSKAPAAEPAPEPAIEPGDETGDDATRDELYRLLAAQEADGEKKGG